ncbi:MAG: molybdopterin-guanine dinucleotide biosynthesis protein B [Burkholderiaceae bacterium]|jgi:molybdopterin-guanine dinucleotide biosynthesis protein B|nr:molybdopterin-guanine dinucleotide biosynthesis protein B [Burkholderiaceae bacterium]
MKVIGFAGYSGAGKTTLIERLIPALRRQGQRASVVKHAHHGFDIDHQGKDSWRHRRAGAFEVLVASAQRLALMRELDPPESPGIDALLAELDRRADWVLVEGYKHAGLPKIEVWRAAPPESPAHNASAPGCLYPHDARVVALVTAHPAALPQPTQLPVFAPEAAEQLAQWLLASAARFDY